MNIRYVMMSVWTSTILCTVDPAHRLHIDKITHGAHLHVTPSPKYSRAIKQWIDNIGRCMLSHYLMKHALNQDTQD